MGKILEFILPILFFVFVGGSLPLIRSDRFSYFFSFFLSIYCMGSGSCLCPKSQITSSPSPSRFSKNRWRFSFASGYPESHKRDKEGLAGSSSFLLQILVSPLLRNLPFSNYISVSVQSGGEDLHRLLPQKPDGISVCIEENIFILLSCCSFLRTGYRSGAARDFCGLFFPAFRILVLYFFSSFWNQDVPRFPDKFLKYNSSLNTCGKGRPLYFYGRTKDVRLNQLSSRVEKKNERARGKVWRW